MRIVIDTNVLVSAFLWGGTPHRLLEHVRTDAIRLTISQALLDEFDHVIARPKFAAILARTTRSPESVMVHLRALAEVVVAQPLPTPVCRDPKDDIILACARSGAAHLVVSGDNDLLTLKTFERIPIVTAAQAVTMMEANTGG